MGPNERVASEPVKGRELKSDWSILPAINADREAKRTAFAV